MAILSRRDDGGRGRNDYDQLCQQALSAWQDSQNYFKNVSDPDLVDYAIYDMEAARKRYVYMLKCARKEQQDGIEEV